MVEFYLLTFPRFPLRMKEHKSYFGKNRTHGFRSSRCAGYLLDHSGDEGSLGWDRQRDYNSAFIGHTHRKSRRGSNKQTGTPAPAPRSPPSKKTNKRPLHANKNRQAVRSAGKRGRGCYNFVPDFGGAGIFTQKKMQKCRASRGVSYTPYVRGCIADGLFLAL